MSEKPERDFFPEGYLDGTFPGPGQVIALASSSLCVVDELKTCCNLSEADMYGVSGIPCFLALPITVAYVIPADVRANSQENSTFPPIFSLMKFRFVVLCCVFRSNSVIITVKPCLWLLIKLLVFNSVEGEA